MPAKLKMIKKFRRSEENLTTEHSQCSGLVHLRNIEIIAPDLAMHIEKRINIENRFGKI